MNLRAYGMVVLLAMALNLLAAIGFVAWLSMSGRLDSERWQRVVEMFKLTIEEEREQIALAEQAEREATQAATEVARLVAAQEGPVTLAHRLAADQQADELALQRVAGLREEIRALRTQVESARVALARQRSELDADREAFEQYRKRETELRQDQDFQRAVRMYEQLRPRQAKQMFQVMLDEGRQSEVIDYLAAMQLRVAANVLKEFKEPDEIAQAAGLVRLLRERGIDVPGVSGATGAGGTT